MEDLQAEGGRTWNLLARVDCFRQSHLPLGKGEISQADCLISADQVIPV